MTVTFDKSKLEETKNGEILTISYADKEAFLNGTELDKKTLVEAFKHSGNYITAATDEAAAIATDRFNDDKELNKVVIDFPFGPTGSGSTTVAVDRSKTFRIPGDTGGSVTRPNIGVKVQHQALKAGKKHIKGLQEAMLEALA